MDEKKRAVIYCRVSTTSDSQMESLEKQVSEAVEAVNQLGYELTDRFIDEGKTGTTKEARKEYLRMLSEIEKNNMDVIVTKSLDRINRNILDFYLFLDLILKNGVQLYFYLDRAFYKADDKIVIGIKAILAEEYSRELSKKLCSAHAKRQERGEVLMLGSMTYGYKKILQSDGKRCVAIEEEEAEMIRFIFACCINGYGTREISRILYEKGYRNRKGNQISESTIRRIIRNPLVMGTMVMNKVRYDFNTKKTVYVEPSKWIWKKNAVPAIISGEVWKSANDSMDSRMRNKTTKSTGKQGINKGKYELSGKIRCGLCGKPYYGIGKEKKSGRELWWSCSTYVRFGRNTDEKNGFKLEDGVCKRNRGQGCNNVSVKDEILIEYLGKVAWERYLSIYSTQSLTEEMIEMLQISMEEGDEKDRQKELQKKCRELSRRQLLLVEKYLDGKVGEDSYLLLEKKLKKEKEKALAELGSRKDGMNGREEEKQRLKEIEAYLNEKGLRYAAACMLLKSVEEITVYPERLEIALKTSEKETNDEPASIMVNVCSCTLEQKKKSDEEKEEKLCNMIKRNPKITISAMAKALEIGERTAFKKVAALKEKGKIGVRGHGPGTVWYVIDDGE